MPSHNICIQNLPIHKVFAVLYNHADNGVSPITEEESERIIKKLEEEKSDFNFDYFDAKQYLEKGTFDCFGVRLKLNLSGIVFNPERYDEDCGKRKIKMTAEELIHQLKVKEVEYLLPIIKSATLTPMERIMGSTRQLTVVENISELWNRCAALQVDIQNFKRIKQANQTIEKMKELSSQSFFSPSQNMINEKETKDSKQCSIM